MSSNCLNWKQVENDTEDVHYVQRRVSVEERSMNQPNKTRPLIYHQ